MKLSIPEQNPPSPSSSSSSPADLKNVLSRLPNSNMGELTKQIYQILRDQNRQTIPCEDRLKNLEMLRVYCGEIFISLKKYFINRTLPLPEKSKKIIYLNQSILQELVHGYEIIAQEAANSGSDNPESSSNNDTNTDDQTLSTAICRAINYLSEMLLRASEVYQPCPKNLWHDSHQLYLFAEKKGLVDTKVTDGESGSETTIAISYKRILLFALARPTTLRQSDCDRIYTKLFEWSEHATIEKQTSEKPADCMFSMKVFEDKAPDYLRQNEITDGSVIRLLNNCNLVSHIGNLITEKNRQKQKLSVGEEIPLETLIALVNSWGNNTDRRFSRAERHGHINVAIGLSKTCKAIHESKKLRDTLPEIDGSFNRSSSRLDNILVGSDHEFFKVSSGSNNDQHLTLESIADDKRHKGYITIGGDEENQWDMVAKGRVLTDSYEKEKQLIDKEQLDRKRNSSDSHWEIVNTSPGGYRLRWNSDDTSTAQIGELIALQEFDSSGNFNWLVGVIRWMQFTPENGLEIGVQILSPKVEAATAQRANRLDETPFDCILMPEIKALNQNASTILPAHAFDKDNKLIVKILHNIMSITLGNPREHTGSFTQFTYSNTELDKNLKQQIKKEEANKNRHDFDELWSSL